MPEFVQICGSFRFMGENYDVYLENRTNLVWLSKPDNFSYGFKNFFKTRANDPLQALKYGADALLRYRVLMN